MTEPRRVARNGVKDMKGIASIAEAIADINDGATMLVGDFGLVGIPENLIHGLREKGRT